MHLCISIHALLAESDPRWVFPTPTRAKFLSTLSLRRATPRSRKTGRLPPFLSTLSLRRATTSLVVIGTNCIISIHALLAESDHGRHCVFCRALQFLSTLSLRRATRAEPPTAGPAAISIHALLAESDGGPGGQNAVILHFYPRSPCGERRIEADKICKFPIISIHALLAESDGIGLVFMWWGVRFLSTLSLRRATHYDNYNLHCVEISIHALLAESDVSFSA